MYGYVGLCMTMCDYAGLCMAVYGYIGLCKAMESNVCHVLTNGEPLYDAEYVLGFHLLSCVFCFSENT